MSTKIYRGRIAPTPSGLLHIGHARTFFTACKRAKERNGKMVLRIEDIDLQRCKQEYVDAAINDLKSIGISWDEGDDVGGKFAPYTQSKRFDLYKFALKKLIDKNLVYQSDASRAQIKKYGKFPSRDLDFAEKEIIFPKELRNKCGLEIFNADEVFNSTWRFKVPDGEKISFYDNNFGAQTFVASEDFGDFVVWRKESSPSYELAVVVDDNAMEITEVVRGKDLLLSTARQILLYKALGYSIPEFYHCQLLKNEANEKISKSAIGKEEKNAFLIRNNTNLRLIDL